LNPPIDADVVVVGAGLAGAAAAQALAASGLRVRVLDKGRGPGGRLSTRHTASGGFDHGASSLQAVGLDFRSWLAALAALGVVAPTPRGEWVGCPGMSAIVAHLLDGLAPQWSAAVARIERVDGHWLARDARGNALGRAPQMVLAVPAPQAKALIAYEWPGHGELMAALASARYGPCWAAMVVTAANVPIAEDARPLRHPEVAVLERVVREAAKPGRPDEHWVLHATTAWSEAHLERTPDEVMPMLREAFLAATGLSADQVLTVTPHRWRYAVPVVGVGHAGTPEWGLHLAGDAVGWQEAGGIPPAELAWRTGRAAAERAVLASNGQPKS
jgi:hypothetical protein